MSESKLQTKILTDLKKRGWLVVKTIALSVNGYPDIFAFHDGKSIFIEVKDEKGVISEIQKYRISELIREGFDAVVVFNFSQYQSFMLNLSTP